MIDFQTNIPIELALSGPGEPILAALAAIRRQKRRTRERTAEQASKASDFSCVPLCRYCHREYHSKGKGTFAERWQVCFEDVVRDLNERWEARQK